jgi:pteridine reductase
MLPTLANEWSAEMGQRVAVVTGAAKRIGATIATTLHAAGFDLILHYRSASDEAKALLQQLNSQRSNSAIAVQADLLANDSAQRLVDAALGHFGRLDALINNASSFYPTPVGAIDGAAFDDLIGTNAKAPLMLSQAASAALKAAHGAIVNLVDIYADRPLPRYVPYCMAKAALVAMTYGLARELGPEVRVNAIAPGNIVWSTNPEKAETLDIVTDRTALKRQGEPTDIARTVSFLLLDAPYITGQVLRVDGGRWLNI